jgi:hypothetical protein
VLQVQPSDTAGLTASFLAHQTELIVGDVKELVSRVSDVHFVEADNLTVPAISYEVRTLLLLLLLLLLLGL